MADELTPPRTHKEQLEFEAIYTRTQNVVRVFAFASPFLLFLAWEWLARMLGYSGSIMLLFIMQFFLMAWLPEGPAYWLAEKKFYKKNSPN